MFRPLAIAGTLAVCAGADASAQTDPYTDVFTLPTPSLYGGIGLLDMRNARFMPDGYLWMGGSLMSPDDRVDINFQATPWLESTFRFTIDYGIPPAGQRAFYKYSLDWKARLFQETRYTPQIAMGMQDFIGLGLFSAEYVVASKRFGPIDATLGMGWGRLASRPAFENPFCAIYSSFCVRPIFITGTNGGTPQFNSYFHGQNVGIFGGIEYNTPIPRLTFKAEYSSDAYVRESNTPVRGAPPDTFINYAPFPVNFGVQYHFWSNVDLGVEYMYGRVPAVSLDIIANPSQPNFGVRFDPMPPFVARTLESNAQSKGNVETANPDTGLDDTWQTHFVDLTQLPNIDARPPDPAMAESVKPALRPSRAPAEPEILATMQSAVEAQGLRVDGIAIRRNTVKVEVENPSYFRDAEAISRVLRVLSATAPADIDAFQVTTAFAHVPLSTVTVPRTQLDAMGQQTGTPAELWESTVLSDARPSTRYGVVQGYPMFQWTLFPAFRDELFDPTNPFYAGIGIAGSTHTELLPGLVLDDQATYGFWSNFSSITRVSNSLLPHVRSDTALYLKHGFTGIDDLMLSYYAKPMPEFYARLTAGYLENMFGAVGGEVLYRPFGQRWAVGADLYEAFQRNQDDLFGFGQYNYHVLTGHASLYVETPWNNTTAVIRVGRYLAGDFGGTFEIYRRFDTGIRVGAWVTLTNVPFSTFGEGSFDKGIMISIPTEWTLPIASTTSFTQIIRPVQRDGGQMLINDANLYDLTQPSSYGDLQRQWPHVFQ